MDLSILSRTQEQNRRPRADAPRVEKVFRFSPEEIPAELLTPAGEATTLRASLGNVFNYFNRETGGALFSGAADLYGSTSIKNANKGFPDGFWNAVTNPGSRLLAVGGICEDAMGALMAGISTYGRSLGAASSYGAFIAALEHIAARLHGIGQQGKKDYNDEPYNPFFLVAAHAGLKTGEDGPTHADPQPLQLLQENFPRGVAVTLTPWDPNEMWPLVTAALRHRPAVIVPFVTRPNETVFDREALGLPPVTAAVKGVYALQRADASRPRHGTLVLQGSGVTNTFVAEVLPEIRRRNLNLNIFYVASSELFDLLPEEEQQAIFPDELRREAMGITGFTLPTMYRWVTSDTGLKRTLHPFRDGRFLGSGQAHKVLEEAGLHGTGQLQAVLDYVENR